MIQDEPAPTARVLTNVLNFRQAGDDPAADNPALRGLSVANLPWLAAANS